MVLRCFTLVLLWAALLAPPLWAGSLWSAVSDQEGEPLAGMVSKEPAQRDAVSVSDAIADQIDQRFVPEGLVVASPTSDNIRHHVYSFSRARSFALKLYAGKPQAPVTFDRPGAVVLGCNIHDSMVGYICVAASPFRATTDVDGAATIAGLPDQVGQVSLWHPRMAEPEQPLIVQRDFDTGARDTVALAPTVTKAEPRNTFEDVFPSRH